MFKRLSITAPTPVKSVQQQTNIFRRYMATIDWDHLLSTLIAGLFQIVLLSALFYLINRLGKSIIKHSFRKYRQTDGFSSNRINTIYTLMINAFSYLVIFFYLYALLSVLGVPVGTLIAGAGIFSLAIGLGAQGFVNDIVTGFFILAEQQFDVGDTVKIGTVEGTVNAIGLRTTQVQSADGTLNFIPNRNISIVSNLSRNDMRVLINIHVLPDTDLQLLTATINAVNVQLIPKHPEIQDGPTILGVTTLPNGVLAFQIMMHTTNGEQATTHRTFLQAYLQALAAAGVSLPNDSWHSRPLI
ncbi:mechanosensitive ion channel family protein [Latilactobacillus graminis]|uniref:Mechanosensitive ion channel family protein n=2 Tax=Latilactobacillus graminis TaxID=60519 RepID=A0AA89I2Q4_9LACO|nr:mechanosensitive ion channel domain-containing protein [Latilactobacillus graminis]KRM24420.1 mechanosensitive ion channel family protein [Latilactobacillus graminis DSM 20719]QFP80030.1 mechanosensitive ion channel [Latilactobacillus graminis]